MNNLKMAVATPTTDEDWAAVGGPVYPHKSEPSKAGSAFVDEMQGLGGGLVGQLGHAAAQYGPEITKPYAEDVRDWGLDTYRENMEESTAGAQAPNVARIEDIKLTEEGGLDRAGDWLAYHGTKGLLTAGSLAFSGFGGGALAQGAVRQGVKTLAKNALKDGAAKSVAKGQLEAAGKKVTEKSLLEFALRSSAKMNKAKRIGNIAGGTAGAYALEGGGSFGQMVTQEGVSPAEALLPSIGVGTINAAIEYLPVFKVMQKLGLTGELRKGIGKVIPKDEKLAAMARRIAGKVLKGAAGTGTAEGITEGIQELVQLAGERWAKDEELLAELSPEAQSQIWNAMAVGAVTGATLGGATGPFVQQPREVVDEKAGETEEAAAGEAEGSETAGTAVAAEGDVGGAGAVVEPPLVPAGPNVVEPEVAATPVERQPADVLSEVELDTTLAQPATVKMLLGQLQKSVDEGVLTPNEGYQKALDLYSNAATVEEAKPTGAQPATAEEFDTAGKKPLKFLPAGDGALQNATNLGDFLNASNPNVEFDEAYKDGQNLIQALQEGTDAEVQSQAAHVANKYGGNVLDQVVEAHEAVTAAVKAEETAAYTQGQVTKLSLDPADTNNETISKIALYLGDNSSISLGDAKSDADDLITTFQTGSLEDVESVSATMEEKYGKQMMESVYSAYENAQPAKVAPPQQTPATKDITPENIAQVIFDNNTQTPTDNSFAQSMDQADFLFAANDLIDANEYGADSDGDTLRANIRAVEKNYGKKAADAVAKLFGVKQSEKTVSTAGNVSTEGWTKSMMFGGTVETWASPDNEGIVQKLGNNWTAVDAEGLSLGDFNTAQEAVDALVAEAKANPIQTEGLYQIHPAGHPDHPGSWILLNQGDVYAEGTAQYWPSKEVAIQAAKIGTAVQQGNADPAGAKLTLDKMAAGVVEQTPVNQDGTPTTEPLDTTGWTKTGGQLGSQPGGTYTDPDGTKWYVKHSKTPEHAANELLAGALYSAAGVKIIEPVAVTTNGKPGTATKWVEGVGPQPDKTKASGILLGDDFVIDAWLANWDVIGLEYDNIMQPGNIRTDFGGALLFRAQGEPKGNLFGNVVGELNSLLDPAVNAQSASVFKDITLDDLARGAAKLAKVTPEQIKALVDQYGPGSPALKTKLAETLIARQKNALSQIVTRIAFEKPDFTKFAAHGQNKNVHNLLTSVNPHDSVWSDIDPAHSRYGVLIINPETGKVLLRQPENNFGGYAWTYAKGGKNPGETPAQAAMRETLEETGKPVRLVGIMPKGFSSGSGSNALFYVGIQKGPDVEMEGETSALKWAKYEDAIPLINETTDPGGKVRDLEILDALFGKSDQNAVSSYQGTPGVQKDAKAHYEGGHFAANNPSYGWAKKAWKDLTARQRLIVAVADEVAQTQPLTEFTPEKMLAKIKRIVQERLENFKKWSAREAGFGGLQGHQGFTLSQVVNGHTEQKGSKDFYKRQQKAIKQLAELGLELDYSNGKWRAIKPSTDSFGLVQSGETIKNILKPLYGLGDVGGTLTAENSEGPFQTGKNIVVRVFHKTNSSHGVEGDVIHMTKHANSGYGGGVNIGFYGAETASKTMGSGKTHEFYFHFKNPLVIPRNGGWSSNMFNKLSHEALVAGHDGLIMLNTIDNAEGHQFIVLNKGSQVKTTEIENLGYKDEMAYNKSMPPVTVAKTVEQARSEVEQELGANFVRRAEKVGLLNFHDEVGPDGASAEFDPNTGKIHIYTQSLTEGSTAAQGIHEGSHATLDLLLNGNLGKFAAEVIAQAKANPDSIAGQAVTRATTAQVVWQADQLGIVQNLWDTPNAQLDAERKRVTAEIEVALKAKPEKERAALDAQAATILAEETLAYYAQLAHDAKASQGLYRRIVNSIKAGWLLSPVGRAFSSIGIKPKLSDGVAVALARRSTQFALELNETAREIANEVDGSFGGVAVKSPGTDDAEGVDRLQSRPTYYRAGDTNAPGPVWFSQSKEHAATYGAEVKSANLEFNNPVIIMNWLEQPYSKAQLEEDIADANVTPIELDFDLVTEGKINSIAAWVSDPRFVKAAKAAGYDAVQGEEETLDGGVTTVGVFDKGQVSTGVGPESNQLFDGSVTRAGKVFATGEPVTFAYTRNKATAPQLNAYQQDLEPAGRYLLLDEDEQTAPIKGWEKGTVTFENPLVLPFNTTPFEIYNETSWKAQLVQHFGKTGKALSQSIADAGYDGVITVDLDPEGKPYDVREIVDLSSFIKPGNQRAVELLAQANLQSQPTNTTAFKAWFGNSKVVNEDGTPKVVYRGTTGIEREPGIWYTDDTWTANMFSEGAFELEDNSPDTTPNSVAMFLSMQNPLEVDAKGNIYAEIEFEGDIMDTEAIHDRAIQRGHDGVIFYNIEEGMSGQLATGYAIRDKSQAKSAIANRGTYDGSSNDPLQSRVALQARDGSQAWVLESPSMSQLNGLLNRSAAQARQRGQFFEGIRILGDPRDGTIYAWDAGQELLHDDVAKQMGLDPAKVNIGPYSKQAVTIGQISEALLGMPVGRLQSHPTALIQSYWTSPVSNAAEEINNPGLLNRIQHDYVEKFSDLWQKSKAAATKFNLAKSIRSSTQKNFKEQVVNPWRDLIVNMSKALSTSDKKFTVEDANDSYAAQHIVLDKVNLLLARKNANSQSIELEQKLRAYEKTLQLDDPTRVELRAARTELTKGRGNLLKGLNWDGTQPLAADGVTTRTLTADEVKFKLMEKLEETFNKPIIDTEVWKVHDSIVDVRMAWEAVKNHGAGFATPEHASQRPEVRAEFDARMAADPESAPRDANEIYDRVKDNGLFIQGTETAQEIAKMGREMLKHGQLITQEEADAMAKEYPHWVPLRRREYDFNDAVSAQFGKSKGAGKPMLRAGTPVVDPPVHTMQNLFASYDMAVTAAEGNIAREFFARIIEANPADWARWFIVTQDKSVVKSYGKYGFVQESKTGGDPHDIPFFRDGERWLIKPVKKNQRAMSLSAAIQNLDSQELGPVFQFMSKINSWIRDVNISLSPAFMLMNMPRDYFTARLNLKGTELAEYSKEVGKEAKTSAKQLFRHFMLGETDQDILDWEAAGGRISFVDSLRPNDDSWKSIESEIKHRQGTFNFGPGMEANFGPGVGVAVGKARAGLEKIEQMNIIAENVMRYSTWKVAIRHGVPVDKAALLSKDVTTNFDRSGRRAQTLGIYWLFYNATVQGNAQVLRNTFKGANKEKLWGALAAVVATAFLNDQIGAALSDDEDRDGRSDWDSTPDWKKEKFGRMAGSNLFWPGDENKFVTLPLPWVFNTVWRFGEMLSEAARGKRDASDIPGEMAGMMLNTFNPIGGSDSSLAQMAAPTAFDPLVQIWENEDAFGRPLGPTTFPGQEETPDSQLNWMSEPKGYKWLARTVNGITGGSAGEKGVVDWRPSTFRVLADTLAGGGGRFMGQLGASIASTAKGEPPAAEKWPGVKTFLFNPADPIEAQLYHERQAKIAQAVKAEKVFKAGPQRDLMELQRVRTEYAGELRMAAAAKDAEKQIKQIRKHMHAAQVRGNEAQVKQFKARIEQVQQRMNKTWGRRVGN